MSNISYVLQRNEYCDANGCPVTGSNTVFVVTLAQTTDEHFWGNYGNYGKDNIKFGNTGVRAYQCGNLPTTSPWDGGAGYGGYCFLKGLYYPGPFAETNGHFWVNKMTPV